MPASEHPRLDLEKWLSFFPIEKFEKRSGPHRFSHAEPDDPQDRWKVSGEMITTPAHLCAIEHVRRRIGKNHDLGREVPVDIFLWNTGAPDKPYLTKIGGIPHREAALPWPSAKKTGPYTFIAQFCFLDSKDIVSDKIPGDVMLVFFRDSDGDCGDKGDVHVEWTAKELAKPLLAEECPTPTFPVPELSGIIHRYREYPEAGEVFYKEGHGDDYLFGTTQSTKIGRETFFIQNDPRERGQELLCTLNSIHPHPECPDPAGEWPFLNLQHYPESAYDDGRGLEHRGWGKYKMLFCDVGCYYFLIDERGRVSCTFDCY